MGKMWMEFGPGTETWTEKQFQSAIERDLAPYFGFTKSYHTVYSIGSDRGWPDLCLANATEGGIIWFEVKGPKNAIKPEQVEWITVLQKAGQHAYIVRPKDLDLVQLILRGDARPPHIGSGTIDPIVSRLEEYQK